MCAWVFLGGVDRIVKVFWSTPNLKYDPANTYANLPMVSYFKILRLLKNFHILEMATKIHM